MRAISAIARSLSAVGCLAAVREHGDGKPPTVGERDITDVVGNSAYGSGLVRDGRSLRQQPLETASAGARARHDAQQELAAFRAHRRASVDGKQEFQIRNGRCVVAGIRLEVRIAINLGRHQCRVVADRPQRQLLG